MVPTVDGVGFGDGETPGRRCLNGLNYQLAAQLCVRLLNLMLQRFGSQRADADDAQDDQR